MSVHRAEREALDVLGALGRVDPPSAAVLAAARQSLLSQVAGEALRADLAEDAARQFRQDSAHRPTPRRKPERSPEPRRQRRAGE
jgi:hypothetical protein